MVERPEPATVRVRRSGGSLIVTVPAALRDALRLFEGQQLTVMVDDDRLVYERRKRRRPKYTLEELLAQCDPDAPLSEEEKAWLNAPPVGREIL